MEELYYTFPSKFLFFFSETNLHKTLTGPNVAVQSMHFINHFSLFPNCELSEIYLYYCHLETSVAPLSDWDQVKFFYSFLHLYILLSTKALYIMRIQKQLYSWYKSIILKTLAENNRFIRAYRKQLCSVSKDI